MYGTNKDRAATLAIYANANADFRPSNLGQDRNVIRYEVRAHAWGLDDKPSTWGVWPVWAYADRPDLGSSFGGPFVILAELES